MADCTEGECNLCFIEIFFSSVFLIAQRLTVSKVHLLEKHNKTFAENTASFSRTHFDFRNIDDMYGVER